MPKKIEIPQRELDKKEIGYKRRKKHSDKLLVKKETWWDWETKEIAIASAPLSQSKYWDDTERFRLLINNHHTYPHMRPWLKLLNTGEDSRYLNGIAGTDTLILAPRESAKSTFLAQWIAQQLGRHTAPWCKISLKILCVSYDLTTAAQRSRQIRAIVSSKAYQQIFPWVRPSTEKWGEREWAIDFQWAGLPTTEEQYTFVCSGLSGAINSRRCHIILYDDIIKSTESIEADTVRDRMVSNHDNVISYTRYDGSRAVCLGTRFTSNDIYCTTFIKEKGWQVLEQSALLTYPDGTEYSYWEPEGPNAPGTPLTRLQDEREKKPISFSFQRQNKIVRVQEQSIDPGMIQRGILPSRFENLVLGVDLSAGLKESNDYTAFVLGGVLRVGDGLQYWVIDTWEDRIMGNTPKLDAMVEMWDTWKHLLPQTQRFNPKNGEWESCPVVGLELWFDSSAYGLSLQGDYTDHIVNRLGIQDWIVRPISASGRGGKLERLRRHTGLFHNKLVFFNMYGRTMPDGRKPLGRLIQQITEFGSTSHDDLADSFELCLFGLRGHLPISKGNY